MICNVELLPCSDGSSFGRKGSAVRAAAISASSEVQEEPAANPMQGGLQPLLQQKQSVPAAFDSPEMEHQAACTGWSTRARKAAQPNTRSEVTAIPQAADNRETGCRRGRQQQARGDMKGPRSAARVTVAASPCRSPPSCAALLPPRIPPRGVAKPPARHVDCDSRSSSSRRAGGCRCLLRMLRHRRSRIAPL